MIEGSQDLCNLRLVNKRCDEAFKYALAKRISNDMTIYPRYASMKAIITAVQIKGVADHVRHIELLAEGLKEHEYGYAWAWEDLELWANLAFTESDINIINQINTAHAEDVVENGDFIIAGEYRSMLTQLFNLLPNLATITVRKLHPGEQIPGWSGVNLFKELSFFHKSLDTRNIFYGDWQYDTTHLRITQYRDEFGDVISEPHAGPQASFFDDLKAALDASGTEAIVSYATIC
jgi:hypothetical protein